MTALASVALILTLPPLAMVEAEVLEQPTAETNGFPHSDPINDKLATVGEEKKVRLSS